jgi:hypothetical protein
LNFAKLLTETDEATFAAENADSCRMEPNLTLPMNVHADPSRTKFLTLIPDPYSTEAKTDIVLPTLWKHLTDKSLPKPIASVSETWSPTRPFPVKDIPLPNLMKLRTDTELPTLK